MELVFKTFIVSLQIQVIQGHKNLYQKHDDLCSGNQNQQMTKIIASVSPTTFKECLCLFVDFGFLNIEYHSFDGTTFCLSLIGITLR